MFQTQHRGSILKGIYIVRMSDIVLCILFVRKKKKEVDSKQDRIPRTNDLPDNFQPEFKAAGSEHFF